MIQKQTIPFTWSGRSVAMQHLSPIRTYFVSISEELFEPGAALLVMIMVEHRYGRRGLGIYAFLTACLFAVRSLAQYGVTQHVAREVARYDGNRPKQNAVYQAGYQALACTGKDLLIKLSIRKFDFAIAGLSVYLVFTLLKQWGGAALDFWLGPILLGVLFWLSGLYGTGVQPSPVAGKAS